MINIQVFEGVSAVLFNQVSSEDYNEFTGNVFERIAQAGINIDMISSIPATSDKTGFGFTFSDSDMPKLMALIKTVKLNNVPAPLVSIGNVKIVIQASEMKLETGFAAKVFAALNEASCQPLMITTALDEISILVRESDASEVGQRLAHIFNIQ
jgi:aspartokinase